MDHHIINTLTTGERVTSTYAEVYFESDYCKTKKPEENNIVKVKNAKSLRDLGISHEEWISPSDLLVGIIKLKPPFTSKITRGKTHEGLLAIGNSVLENERTRHYKSLTNLLHENDASWECIMRNEKKAITKKVKDIFEQIFIKKRDIMTKEIILFYAKSLSDLEEHLKSEIKIVLQSTHASTISHLNNEIQFKLKKERKSLENFTSKKYMSEVKKIKEYYTLLLNNELSKHNKLRDHIFKDRNDALKAYYKLIEAERITSAMYVLSLERKKCKIKKMLVEKYQDNEVKEKLKKLKERKDLLNMFKEKETHISELNNHWEEKTKKILQVFLKFISFSLKLLPEQTTFLLDLEKMVVLQLNEIQKNPNIASTILIDEKENDNTFKFEKPEHLKPVCEKDPFILIGDLSEPEPPKYGSRETLPSDVDLQYFRVQRQYVYAKCHGYEDIKKMIEAQVCRCNQPTDTTLQISTNPTEEITTQPPTPSESTSSNEWLIVDDIQRCQECPVRKCVDWARRNSFPNMAFYLDYNEENFNRVKTILTDFPKKYVAPNLTNPKDIAYSELPFSATKELLKTTETQYSSQEDLDATLLPCPCIEGTFAPKKQGSEQSQKVSSELSLKEILTKRNTSLQRLFKDHPKLLQLLTDEQYDYKL